MNLSRLDVTQVLEQDVGHLHGHTTEVGNKMRTRLVTSEGTFYKSAPTSKQLKPTRALDRVLTTKGKHVATVAAPIGTHVGVGREAMRDAVVDLLLVAFCVGV